MRRPGLVPLARALSKLGQASRAEARLLVLDGRVRVSGRVVRDPATLVNPDRTAIVVDGVRATRPMPRLVAFHKPRGLVTTRHDPEGRPTVYDALGEAARGLLAIGRLDRASTGLLLFTNDTQLAHRLTDPSRAVPRRYIVTVRGRVSAVTVAALEAGVQVTGSRSAEPADWLRAGSVRVRKASARETHLIVDLTEGKNREIRRLFGTFAHEVTKIHRVAFGPYELGSLAPGAWREEPLETRSPPSGGADLTTARARGA